MVKIDMEMPKNCGECEIWLVCEDLYCPVDKAGRNPEDPWMKRPDWCPLVEVKDDD